MLSPMIMSRKLWPLAVAVSLVACSSSTYRTDLGVIGSRHEGSIALQNASGTLVLHDEHNSLNADLGLSDVEASPYLRFQWDDGVHRVRTHGFGLESSGTGNLAGDFGDIVDGSQVTTSMQYMSIASGYSFALVNTYDYRIGIGAQLSFQMLDIAARSATLYEKVESDVIVPMPLVDGEFYIGDWLTVGANAGVMGSDLGDADGRYWDAEAWVRWNIQQNVQLTLGYRYLLMDAHGRASDRDFDADLELNGLWVTGGVTF